VSDTRTPTPAPEADRETVQGERHVSEVAGNSNPALGKKAGVAGIAALAVIACGAILLTSQKPDLKTNPGPELEARPMVRYEAPPLPAQQPTQPPLTPEQQAQAGQPPLPVQQVQTGAGGGGQSVPAAPRAAPRLLIYNANGGFGGAGGGQGGAGMVPAGYQDAQGGMAGPGGSGGAGGQEGGDRDSLAARLAPTRLNGVSANVLQNQPYLLTTGTLMPCVLQTAMDSTLPGFVTCVIPQDILGKTGLTLLDRGTKVVGQFQGGIRQGVERMFVVWTRAETPQGVVINLDSPATDPLGRTGMDGAVNRHFWKRFGGAIVLSVVDGALLAGQSAVAKSGTVTVNTGNTSSVIGETLRGSTNIPPTIRKNQGELVSIFVARDLDFSSVYRVAPTPAFAAGGR
jgi:type IV secretion system protein VirB10